MEITNYGNNKLKLSILSLSIFGLVLFANNKLSEAASLVEVVHGVRVTPSLAFCGSDPMHLLPVPDLLAKMNLFIAQVHQVVGVS